MKNLIPLIAAAGTALTMSAATVVTNGDGRLSYFENAPDCCLIQIDFAPCMANALFTFSDVWLNGKNLNHTDSDNIGPFGIAGKGWSGGNHLNGDIRSARTDSVRVFLDGAPLDLCKPSVAQGGTLTVEVFNTLLQPFDTAAVFADEHYRYNVSGNSIEVFGNHTFRNAEPLVIDRYYGMQSMFIGEAETLTPGGKYTQWTPIAEVSEFTKASAPRFTLFVEHSPYGYQASWIDPAYGLGDRAMVDPSDVVFIGNSWSKAYHKTIGSRTVSNGDRTQWHGVYSWFDSPIADNARGGDGSFSYPASLPGQPVAFSAAADGTVSIEPMSRMRFPERKLTVMSYNLRFGERASMDRLAEEIKAASPDFVALQEVDVHAGRTAAGDNRGLNYINELAQRTGMFGYYGRTINFLGGYYGIGILSKHPATDVSTIPLPNPQNTEPRVVLKGRFLLDGKQPFVFASTHLDFKDPRTTVLQAQTLVPVLAAQGIPAIVAGDFNTSPRDEAIKYMTSQCAVLSGSAPTYPADVPMAKIDHIFGLPTSSFSLEETHEGTPSENAASDHLPVISTVILKPY